MHRTLPYRGAINVRAQVNVLTAKTKDHTIAHVTRANTFKRRLNSSRNRQNIFLRIRITRHTHPITRDTTAVLDVSLSLRTSPGFLSAYLHLLTFFFVSLGLRFRAPACRYQFFRAYLVGLETIRMRIFFPKTKSLCHSALSGGRRPCPIIPPLAPMIVRSPSDHSPKSSSRAHAVMQRRYRASSNDSTEDLYEAMRYCDRHCLKQAFHEALEQASQRSLKQALRQAMPQHLGVCLDALSAGQTIRYYFSRNKRQVLPHCHRL